MIIHGKNVQLVFGNAVEIPEFSNKGIRELKKLQSKTKLTYGSDLVQNILNKNFQIFFSIFNKLIETACLEVLRIRPEFITSNNFSVHIVYSTEGERAASYDQIKSSDNDAFVTIIVDLMLFEALNGGFDFVKEALFHELVHHLDRYRAKRSTLLTDRIARKLGGKRIGDNLVYEYGPGYHSLAKIFFPLNYNKLIKLFNELRAEGLTTVATHSRIKGRIKFSKKALYNINSYLNYLCEMFDQRIGGLREKLEIDKLVYEAGAMMVAIIVLYELFKQDKGYSIWIVPTGFRLFGRKEYNSRQIGEFFGKMDFWLEFKDPEMDNLVFALVQQLSRLNTIQFLKLYEQACAYFKINHPVFNLNSYRYYKRKCKENYRRLSSKVDRK